MSFNELLGKTITKIEGCEKGHDEIIFYLSSGEKYKMFHDRDCCESVLVEDVCGDIEDVLNSEITQAEEVTSKENPKDVNMDNEGWGESFTWTFYKLGTGKGSITIRWYGSSNGYYSESVDFEKV